MDKFAARVMNVSFWVVPAVFLWLAGAAQGQVVAVSNQENASEGTFSVGDQFSSGTRSGSDLAQAFTTSSSGPATLTSVSLSMQDSDIPGGSFRVSLYSDSAGMPGGLITQFSGSSNPETDGQYTYTAPANTLLSSSTPYWIVAEVDHTAPDKHYGWSYTNDPEPTGEAGWTLGASAANFYQNGASVNGWALQTEAFQRLSIAVVPEPAESACVMALGALAFVGLRYWRRSASRASCSR